MANIRQKEGKTQIWDVVRRRWVSYTPEEGVRQWLAEYLVSTGVEHWRMAVEIALETDQRKLRVDLLVYNRQSRPVMICECKAPEIVIDDGVFLQAANYNREMKVPYLVVTNGTVLYCAEVDSETGSYKFLDVLPEL